MSILCKLGGHAAAEQEVWNDGYHFGSCRRCGGDMLRSGDLWTEVPAGHRVVWKGGRHRHSISADYRRDLPALYAKERGGCRALPFAAWNRRLVEVAGSGAASRQVRNGAEEDSDCQPYPYVLALAAIVGAGLQLLFRYRMTRA